MVCNFDSDKNLQLVKSGTGGLNELKEQLDEKAVGSPEQGNGWIGKRVGFALRMHSSHRLHPVVCDTDRGGGSESAGR